MCQPKIAQKLGQLQRGTSRKITRKLKQRLMGGRLTPLTSIFNTSLNVFQNKVTQIK